MARAGCMSLSGTVFAVSPFRNGKEVLLQSKAGQPLGRYFPELVAALADLPERRFVLDGEIVIFSAGHLSFDDLLLRIHPAESRIRKLSTESLSPLCASICWWVTKAKSSQIYLSSNGARSWCNCSVVFHRKEWLVFPPRRPIRHKRSNGCASLGPWVWMESLPSV